MSFLVNDLSIIRSNFEVGSSFPSGSGMVGQGIAIWGGTGYRIEENYLTPYTGAVDPASVVGIFINQTGDRYNQVYNNELENLHCANLVNGNNGGKEEGLVFICNENTANQFDFANPEINTPEAGINRRQEGINFSAAGNTFTTIPPNLESHFLNNNPYKKIRYRYYQIAPEEEPTNYTLLNVIPVSDQYFKPLSFQSAL